METNQKRIVIIGGGISGLTCLHYLQKKFNNRSDVEILLLEKNDRVGGTINTINTSETLFETGPNAFLNNKSQTLELIKELALENEIIEADQQAKVRYICKDNQLYPVPSNPKALISFSLMNFSEKLLLFKEPFVKKGSDPSESLFDFGVRRFGQKCSELFLDPVASGVFAGDSKKLILKESFPSIYDNEQNYGSVINGLFKQAKMAKSKGLPKRKLLSFKKGMGAIVDSLYKRHIKNIKLNINVVEIKKNNSKWCIKLKDEEMMADQLILSLPSYVASKLISLFDAKLAQSMDNIYYAPVVVVGLTYLKKDLPLLPNGFGYLNLSDENKAVLGVLFEHQIFSSRDYKDKAVFRIMIGGARNPNIIDQSNDDVLLAVYEELQKVLKINVKPKEVFYQSWEKAIPQYDKRYVEFKNLWKDSSLRNQNIKIVTNYLNGVSFNDCIENAFNAANSVDL